MFRKHSFKLPLLIIALGAGLKVTQVPAQGPSSLTETYGAWTVQCQNAETETEGSPRRACQVSQELRQSATGTRIVLVAFTAPQDGEGPAQVTIVTPFGLLLPEGLSLKIGEADFLEIPFKTCLQGVGCLAESVLSEAQFDALAAGRALNLGMVAANSQKLRTIMVLEGLGPAFERLQALH